MNVPLKIAILSHMSDMQMEIYMPEKLNHVHAKLNFVKRLVLKLDSGIKEMSEEDLDKLWAETL